MGNLTLDEDEMQAIILMARSLRQFAKHRTVASLIDYLRTEEMLAEVGGKLYWHHPSFKLFKQVEDKFVARLKENGIKVLPKKPK